MWKLLRKNYKNIHMFKVILYLNNTQKPVVFTCSEDKEELVKKLQTFLHNDDVLQLENVDVFIVPDKNDIKGLLVTTEKNND